MNCYFLSDISSHLKINGEYVGVISNNLKKVTVNCDKPLIEFLPCNTLYQSVYGNKNTANLKTFMVNNCLICMPLFSKVNNYPFKVIGQKQKNSYSLYATLTVVLDGCVKFFLDGTISAVNRLPFIPTDFNVEFYQNFIILSFHAEKTALFVYSTDSGNLIFSDLVDQFRISNFIEVEKRYKTVTKTTLIESWSFEENSQLYSRHDVKEKDFYEINSYILPIAFFENVIIGGSVEKVVTPEFNARLIQLREFLGKVIKITPSPFDRNEVFLIKSDCLTAVKLEYTNRLISNVLAEDYF